MPWVYAYTFAMINIFKYYFQVLCTREVAPGTFSDKNYEQNYEKKYETKN